MKEFSTAANRVAKDGDTTIPFKIDGVEYRAYMPSPAQFAVLLASIGQHSSEVDMVAGIIDFFVSVLDKRSHTEIVRRLLDRDDPLEIEQVEAVMKWLIEEWSGRPTEGPSASTPSPSSGGPRSTEAAPALT